MLLLQIISDAGLNTLFSSLIASGPIAAILFYFLIQLWKKNNAQDEYIKTLNSDLRDIDKASAEAMNKLSASVESLRELIKTIINK